MHNAELTVMIKGKPVKLSENDIRRFMSRITKTEGCWLVPIVDKSGYGKISIGASGSVGAHRFSFIIHHGAIPDGMCVCHRCDVPNCVNPDHLFLGDHVDNVADRVAKGRSRGASGDQHWSRTKPECRAKGVDLPNARLKEADVVEIRKAYAEGWRVADLMEIFGIHQATAYDVIRLITWKHVRAPDGYPYVLK